MTSYRRLKSPGDAYIFTLCLEDRESTLLVDHIDALRAAYCATLRELPALCPAIVVLPNHLHAIWVEPPGEVNYSERWRRIKARFSHTIGKAPVISPSKLRRREAGLWQRRFWEHRIRTAAEFVAIMDDCRMNPVRHGLVAQPEDWEFSSFTRRMGNIAHPTLPYRPRQIQPPPNTRLPSCA